jgi:O-antigen ligase
MWVSTLSSDYESIAIKFAIKYTIYFALFLLFLVLTHQFKYSALIEYYMLILYFLITLAGFGFLEKLNPEASIFEWVRSTNLSFNDAFPTARVFSLLQNPNDFGALMVLGLILVLALYKQVYLSTPRFFLYTLAFIPNIIFSASRNAFITLFIISLVALTFFDIFRRNHLYIFLIIIIILFSFNPQSFNRITQSTNFSLRNFSNITQYLQYGELADKALPHRILIWNVALKQVAKNPLTGIGPQALAEGVFANHPKIRRGMNAHNLILGILVELGYPGLLIFIGLLHCLLRGINYSNPIHSLPIFTIFSVQIFDYFIHSLPFITVMLLIMALTANSKFLINDVAE